MENNMRNKDTEISIILIQILEFIKLKSNDKEEIEYIENLISIALNK